MGRKPQVLGQQHIKNENNIYEKELYLLYIENVFFQISSFNIKLLYSIDELYTQ